MCLEYRRYVGDLDPLSKYPHSILCRGEDTEAILYPPLDIPPDEPYKLWGEC